MGLQTWGLQVGCEGRPVGQAPAHARSGGCLQSHKLQEAKGHIAKLEAAYLEQATVNAQLQSKVKDGAQGKEFVLRLAPAKFAPLGVVASRPVSLPPELTGLFVCLPPCCRPQAAGRAGEEDPTHPVCACRPEQDSAVADGPAAKRCGSFCPAC